MSKVAQYRDLERQIADQLAKLDEIKADKAFQQEAEFEDKLRKLLDKYGMSLKNVIEILDPHAAKGRAQAQEAKGQRRERALKRYVNPNTNEVVETKGGNHKVLKAWKEEHGVKTVESWLQS